MDGKVYPDTRARCTECGSSSFESKVKLSGFTIPYCKCGGHPNKFRLTSYFPDASKKSGRSRTEDIRFTDTGERISDPGTAVYMLKQIEKEIDLGSFKPEKYTSTKNRAKFLISNIAAEYIKFNEARREDPDDKISKRTLRDKKTIMKKHIVPIYGHLDIQQLSKKNIKELFSKVKSNRRRVHEELTQLLKFAKHEMEIVFTIPPLPKKPSSSYRDETTIPDIDCTWKVIEHLDDPRAKAVSIICMVYLLRPSDVLTIKPCDIDRKSRTLKIQRHDSDGICEEGRKSDSKKKQREIHVLPIVNELDMALDLVARPPSSEDFYFTGTKEGSYYPYSTFNNAWIRARKAAGYPDLPFYTSTKHARATDLIAKGFTSEQVRRVAGIGAKAFEHYSRLKAHQVENVVIDFDRERFKRAIG
ncbi:hypothetical protein HBN50_07985 [Halobacteriovorax sp. GB3]|uniref:hypothetical protein n=1 Tax=Halobacteriovorax sp. GB3 TaxID=2719615 RepID=UPI0023600CDF|nr:hypothetical protein [Halobacteriovorax sp. GB3]MDD0853032.1 hypothetical protein [Halobacteriovorax sp. GB3]